MRFMVLGAAGRMGSMHARHLMELGHEVVQVDPALPPLMDNNENWWVLPADGVVIATPAELHAEHLMKAIKHDFHVFIEKPICLIPHLPDARRAVQTAMEKRLVVSVGYNLRFHPLVVMERQRIVSRAMSPLWGSFVLRQNMTRHVNFLEEWASHEIDLALHLFGRHWQDIKTLTRSDLPGVEQIQIMIRHQDGENPVSFIHVDGWKTEPFRRSFTIVDQDGVSRHHDIETNHVHPDHYKTELKDWIAKIEGNDFNLRLATGADGIAVIDLLQRVMVKNGVRKSAVDRSPAGI